MKHLYLVVIFCALTAPSLAQSGGINEPKDRKPGLFNELPDSIPVEQTSLDALISLDAGSEVILGLSNARQPLKGTVMASSEKYNGRIQSVTVRSSAHEGALLHLTRSVMDDGNVVFRGTWMHKDYAELYLLSKSNGGYQLVRKKFTDLVIE